MSSYSSSENKYYAIISMSYLFLSCTKKKILKLHQKASKRLRGIRRMASFHEDKGVHNWTDDPNLYTNKKFLKGFEHIAQHNLSFDAWVYSIDQLGRK